MTMSKKAHDACTAALRNTLRMVEAGEVEQCFLVALTTNGEKIEADGQAFGTNDGCMMGIVLLANLMTCHCGDKACVVDRFKTAVTSILGDEYNAELTTSPMPSPHLH